MDTFIPFLALLLTSIISILVFLGLMKWLSVWPVFIVEVFMLGGACFFFRHRLKEMFTSSFEKFLHPHWLSFPKFWIGIIFSAFFVFILLVEGFNAAIQPPWAYDSIAYHMPFAAEWLQTGAIRQIPFTPYAGPLGYYPASSELVVLWSLLPLHADALANFVTFFYAFVFFIAAYALCREFGGSPFLSFFFPLAVISVPALIKEVGTTQSDLFLIMAYVLCAYFLVLFSKRSRLPYLFLAIAALGMVIGSKYLALPFSVPLFAAAIWLLFKQKVSLKHLPLAILVLILTGGVWYIRNWIIAGNPLYPAHVELFGYTLFQGIAGMTEKIFGWSLLGSVNTFTDFKNFLIPYVQRIGWHVLIFPLAGCCFFIEWMRSKHRKELTSLWGFYLLSLFFFALYWMAPYSSSDLVANVRYSFLFVTTAFLSIILTAEKIQWSRVVIFPLAVAAFFINISLIMKPNITEQTLDFVWVSKYPVLFVAYLSLILVVISLFIFLWKKQKISITFLAMPFLVIFLPFFLPARDAERFPALQRKYPQFTNLFASQQWTLNHTLPGDHIAYSGFPLKYFLYGAQLDRTPVYANINDCGDCLYHQFLGANILQNPSKEQWIKNLTKISPKYLLLYNLNGFMLHEPRWVSAENFPLVYKSGEVAVYSVPLGRAVEARLSN
ncbi:MAG: hypothetical protein AAB588_04175 [Patescibacteria group bacterium]